jgi:hypothetical protein
VRSLRAFLPVCVLLILAAGVANWTEIVAASANTNNKNQASKESSQTQHAHDYKSLKAKEAATATHLVPKHRKFVSYTPSKWEQLWLDNVDEWAKAKKICDVILVDQAEFVHDFMKLTCTSFVGDKWCRMDDAYRPLWYNTDDRTKFNVSFDQPPELDGIPIPPPNPVKPGPEHEHIVSKFVFLDETTGLEYTEYIEPLVSHLRHPLSQCLNASKPFLWVSVFRGYVLPPPSKPPIGDGKVLYFDAGSSSWSKGAGGPSLSYFTSVWKRHGIEFDRIQAYELRTPPKDFYQSVPAHFQNKTIYRQCAVASYFDEETIDSPFLPNEIARIAKPDDYVFFKLDIDSPPVEDGSIQYILNNDEVHVDELAWEHHGTFLMMWL